MVKERILYLFILSAIIIVAGLNYLPKPDISDELSKQFWIKKTFADPHYDAIIIGDSRVYRGVSPGEISKSNGGIKVLNFGFSSAGLNDYLIERGIAKLNPEGKKIVVFGISMFSFTKESVANEHLKLLEKTKREEVLGVFYLADLRNLFAPIDPQYLIQKKYNQEAKLKSKPDYYHQRFEAEGWVASNIQEYDLNKTLKEYKKAFERSKPDKILIKNFLLKVKELRGKGYKVYGYISPISPELAALESEFEPEFSEEIRAVFQGSGGKWIDVPIATKNSYDGSHLNEVGAIDLSRIIANGIH